MTYQYLNTLYVMLEGTYLRLDYETVRIEHESAPVKQIPLHHLGAIVLFGNIGISPALIHKCAEDGRSIVWLDSNGRFKARMEGAVSGNVLLRRAQHETLSNPDRTLQLAKRFVAGKLQNTYRLLMRTARTLQPNEAETAQRLYDSAQSLREWLEALVSATSLDEVRGVEGQASKVYFEVFDLLIRAQRNEFRFGGRSRRPPRNRVNALLSFLYTLTRVDCESALESVGLDPQVGYLHALRPGRPALALDLMEEFRVLLADRLALNLINLRQIQPEHFEEHPGGAVYLNVDGRKLVLTEYQKHKQSALSHPLLKQRVPLGLTPHIQARLLARTLRRDIPDYPPFTPR